MSVYHATTWPDVAMALVTNGVQIITALCGLVAAIAGVRNWLSITKGNAAKDRIEAKVDTVAQQTNGITAKLVTAGEARGNIAGRAEEQQAEHERANASAARLNEIRGEV